VYLRLFLGQTWDVADHSERKLATVLFADLVDSTAAAGDQDPERTRARLERFYDAMVLCERTKRCWRRPTSASARWGSTGTLTRPRRSSGSGTPQTGSNGLFQPMRAAFG
jgi:hypothetical protein